MGLFAPELLSKAWHTGLPLRELLKAELTLKQATPAPSPVSNRKASPGFTISRDGGKRIPYYILLADAPASPFSANAPAKLEPGTFRLPMPSRAQVKSN